MATSERTSRTHVVPGNILSVEFKLFDIMTLKQFLYMVVCFFIGYLLILFLPDNIIKYLLAVVIVILGILVAFARSNGEPFEVFATNFLLGILQPQRRTWSKVPMQKTVSKSQTTANSNAEQKAINAVKDNFVESDEVIPVSYNFSLNNTLVDDAEKNFLQNVAITDTHMNNKSVSSADLSGLNFSFAMQPKSDNIIKLSNNLNIKSANMPPQNQDMNLIGQIPQSTVTNTQSPFNIDMDDEHKNVSNDIEFVDLKDLQSPPLPTVSQQSSMSLDTPSTLPEIKHEDIVTTSTVPSNTNTEISVDKIHGKVISADLHSMPNMKVGMYDANGVEIESTISNEKGEFVFQSMPKSFEIRIVSPNKFIFSPLDKQTKEIIIHEINESIHTDSFPTSLKHESLQNFESLEDTNEVNNADAQIFNTINGIVKDQDGHYLTGVLVSIKDANGVTIRALATNPLGQFFSHSALPNGKYEIMFEKDGYKFETYLAELNGITYSPKLFHATKI